MRPRSSMCSSRDPSGGRLNVKLYIGNLPYSTGEDELRSLFENHGQVDSVKVITDRNTGRSRGFGFVEMPDDLARAAMEALGGQDLGGRKLVVDEARPQRGGGRFDRR